MEVALDVLSFALKALITVVALITVIGAVVSMASRQGRASAGHLVVRRLNSRFAALVSALRGAVFGRKEAKRARRRERRKERDGRRRQRVFVLDFHGDLAATQVRALRHEVSTVLGVAQEGDEVVLRLESSGGLVHAYGLAASQIARIKGKGLRFTICVDRIAASGGYMMACLGDELLAAPFAIIGSIGVVASVPNLHRWLERHGVDYEEMTAGEFKRTVSFLGRISPEGREKFQEQLEDTHGLFKDFVKDNRPGIDIDKVATGEYWFGTRAKELSLVDRLVTSDDYLLERMAVAEVFHVSYKPPQPWRQRLGTAAAGAMEQAAFRLWGRLERSRYV